MLDVKKLLSKVLNTITVKTATTSSTLSYHSAKLNFKKQGNVVYCFISGVFTSLPVNGYTSAGQTIPTGFRPNETIYMRQESGQSAAVNIMLRIESTGAISFYNYSGSAYSGNGNFYCTYIIQ